MYRHGDHTDTALTRLISLTRSSARGEHSEDWTNLFETDPRLALHPNHLRRIIRSRHISLIERKASQTFCRHVRGTVASAGN